MPGEEEHLGYGEEFGEGAEIIESEGDMMDGSSFSEGGSEGEEELDHAQPAYDEDEEDEGECLDRKLHDLFPNNGEPVYSIDVHPTDKTLIVTGGGDDWARLIRYEHMTEEYHLVAEMGPNDDSVVAVKFSTDGKLIATGSMDGSVKIWDGISGAPLQVLDGPNEVVWIDWHPRGPVIAAGAEDGTVWMWNAQNGVCMNVFSGNAVRSNVGCFSPDGKWLVSAGEGIVQVWNPKEGRAEVTYDRALGHPIPHSDIVSIAVNPGSNLIAAGTSDGSLVLLTLTHNQVRHHLQNHTDAIEGLAFHPNPKFNYLVSAGLDAQILIWDLNTFQVRTKCVVGADEGITSLRWLTDPDTFITTSCNGMASVWDGRSGVCVDRMGFKDVPCLAVAPIPSMNLLFCAYDNGRIASFAYN